MFGEALGRVGPVEQDALVADWARCPVAGYRANAPRIYTALAAGHEENDGLMQSEESLEVEVAAIPDIERTRLEAEPIEHVHVAQRAVDDANEDRDGSAHIEGRAQLDGSLGRAKRRSLEQTYSQVDSGGAQRVDDFGQARPKLPVVQLVGGGQRGAAHGAAKTAACGLAAMVDRVASMSRSDSRQVISAKAVTRNFSVHRRRPGPESPP